VSPSFLEVLKTSAHTTESLDGSEPSTDSVVGW
jgi:hypothetical protein